jgi:hypothetical protein
LLIPFYFGPWPLLAKWLAQASLSDAIKRAVAWLATKIIQLWERVGVGNFNFGLRKWLSPARISLYRMWAWI